MSGCITVPEHSQLIGQAADGNIRTVSSICTIDATQPVRHVRHVLRNYTQALNPDEISVLNWNIYKGNRDKWRDDLLRLSAEQDIVLLQEAVLTEELKSSLNMHNLKWYLNTAFIYNDRQTGVMTAARIDSGSHCGLRSIEPIIRTPKTVLISHYALAGRTEQLLVANIHGINFTFGLAAYHEQLDALEEILVQHHGPIILAGDFNNWSDDRTRRIMEMAERLSLLQLPYENHNRTMVFGSAIDHIFYRGLSVVNHETQQVTSSDHNPITVTFKATQTRIAGNH